MSFNCPYFIDEFTQFVQSLKVKTALEVGYGSGELVEALHQAGIEAEGIDKSTELSNNKQAEYLYNVPWEDFIPTKKYDLVYSSGVIEHYLFSSEMNEFLKKITSFSKKYILTIAPNKNCIAYMNAKAKTTAPWKDELDFTPESLATIHDLAGLTVKQSGAMAAEWPRRFGPEPSEPYLVYCLAAASKATPKTAK
ncbi:MAG: hypothetical protein A4E55_01834 [Pelotomaculum sp. PtaU1.Bin035]|nr:MAG: hypothetical protein A4E55_01834 [Pelotomaculum sp. PtaU1.Bin035]